MRVFTAQYALSPYIKQTRLAFGSTNQCFISCTMCTWFQFKCP